MKPFLLKNGQCITEYGIKRSDILIEGKHIRGIGKIDLNPDELEIIDLTNKLIIPGGIDPHVHLQLHTAAGNSCDDFFSGSRAALAGGTTAIIDFVTPKRFQPYEEALDQRLEEASASMIPVKLHMGITWWDNSSASQILHLIKHRGIKSFKAYLAYTSSIGISYSQLEEIMQLLANEDVVLLIHCEEDANIIRLQNEFIANGQVQPKYHALSRPPQTESEAVKKVIALCRKTNCKTYIVHVSTAESILEIQKAKEEGLPIFAETCPQYLILDESKYNHSFNESAPFVISPPLREKRHSEALWNALRQNVFDVISTDHCPFNLVGQKDAGIHDFRKIPNGAGGLEFRIPLIYSFGLKSGLLSTEQFVRFTSTNAARIFGFDKSGVIAENMFANLCIMDISTEKVLTARQQFQKCDSNIFEGINTQCMVSMSILEGEIAFSSVL
ncbi:MAG: dihydropyrimidinase [Bacteroidales bacterium]|nr:dihydropyrimidinase [Bacteroidales bacterium]